MSELVLGIETSCDETAAAVVDVDGVVLSSVVASQADLHARYGGVVPEVASRRHLELVSPVIRAALEDASTRSRRHRPHRRHAGAGPRRRAARRALGRQGARVGGRHAARPGRPSARPRRDALPRARPARAAVHVPARERGHTLVLSVRDRTGFEVLGSTLDDAAGEAFDKGARLLGLGYPGGAEIDRLARDGDPEAFSFPVARVPGLDLSFSGLKTALLYAVRDLSEAELAARRADLAASYQRAIVRALVGRLRAAAEETGDATIAVVGGVAANSELRAALPDARFAPLSLCTDNAAMIASAARFARSIESPGYLALDAYASV